MPEAGTRTAWFSRTESFYYYLLSPMIYGTLTGHRLSFPTFIPEAHIVFSDRVGYILNVMIHLGMESASDYRTSSSIAENVDVPDAYLNKIIGELADMGYLETKKGPSGGVRLRKRPEEISMNQLLDDTKALEHNSMGDACCVPSRLRKCITEHWIEGFQSDIVGDTTLDDVTKLLASP